MSTTNLAICFAPSLLWPDSSLDVIKNEVPVLVDFMITHALTLYDDQLPELYKQVENIAPVDFSEETTLRKIELIPLKDEEEGEGRVQRFGHRREDSMDTSASEMDSVDEDEDDEDEEDDNHESISDSQLIAHEGLSEKIRRRTPGFSSDMDAEDEEGPVSPYDHPIWRRVDSAGSTNRPMFQTRIRHRSGDSLSGRRRSIAATQAPMIHFSPEMQAISAGSHSQNSSLSSSPQGGYSPKHHHTDTVSGEGGASYRTTAHSDPGKRTKQVSSQHLNSFDHERSYTATRTTQPHSSSTYYDSLLPKERSPYSRVPDSAHSLVRSDDHTHTSRSSNHSISSRSSSGSEHRPHSRGGVTTRVSGRSTGSGGGHSRGRQSASPDPLSELANTPLNQLDREFIKRAISHRFDISSVDFPEGRRPRSRTHHQFPVSFTSTPSSLSAAMVPSQKTLNILGEDEDVKKPQNMEQLTEYPFQKSRRPGGYISKSAGDGKVEVDDRPEAEQHLLSLPRKRPEDLNSAQKSSLYGHSDLVQVGVSSPRDSQMTLTSGGYNSDTESSPSRTLSRQREKMKEVTSPGLSSGYGRAMPLKSVKQPYPMDLSKPSSSTSQSLGNSEPARRQKQAVEIHPDHKPVFSQSHEVKPTPSYYVDSRRHTSTYATPGTSSDRGVKAAEWPSPSQKIRMQRKGSEGRVEIAKIKLGLVDESEDTRTVTEEERRGSMSSTQEKRQVWEELSKNISRAQIRETRSRAGGRQEMTPSYVPSVSMQVNRTTENSRKARSMPNYSRRAVHPARVSSSPNVKTVRVVKYELPTVMKTQKINMKSYNKV